MVNTAGPGTTKACWKEGSGRVNVENRKTVKESNTKMQQKP